METKEKLLLEMKAMDQTTEHLKQFLVPQQVAKFLLLSDKVSSKNTHKQNLFNRARPLKNLTFSASGR